MTKEGFSLHNASFNRLSSLRQKLQEHNLEGVLIPHQDMFQGEYLTPCDEWLAWLSGFTGSAGYIIVLRDKAALFVDGRYTLQAKHQVDETLFSLHTLGTEKTWLQENTDTESRIAFDPWLLAEYEVEAYKAVCAQLLPHPHFLEDLWMDGRPNHPKSPLFDYPLTYAGKSSQDKLTEVRLVLQDHGVDGFLLPPESWSWLLNVRGSDLLYTPIAQGFAWLTQDSVDLFLCNTDVILEGVTVRPIKDLEGFLRQQQQKTLGYAPTQTPFAVVTLFSNKKKLRDPCLLPKACKNPTELEGAKAAHLKDGRAWCAFWRWLKAAWKTQAPLTELDIVEKMLEVRQAQPGFHSLSFPTIAGSGPNGAIIHYKPEPATNRSLQNNELLLIDSGGQYIEGTTDITRTLILGTPTDAMKHHYTLVLKGHIAIAKAVFPKGTTGAQLDTLARYALWQEKCDFAHGTGHGVGSFLSVHEGPQRISKLGHEPLQPGMIVSNEPGYYLEGHYGIRLENLIHVREIDEGWLGFEPLTLVPFDDALIDDALLTEAEKSWLKEYHVMVKERVGEL